ncbi:hypothetical protein [Thiohalophilus sp.]|uniref:hypothetical protein n=1 Tax=Thiohalophilus sp. TaxID=3028392 RepID=UPI003976D49B
MEEDEYRSTYHEINERRCIFEKSINSRRSTCEHGRRFNLADREGVACSSEAGNARCQLFLDLMRKNSSFALQQLRIDGPLPHAKEVKVQTGGLLGLQAQLYPDKKDTGEVENIAGLLRHAQNHYGELDNLPFTELVKTIVRFEGRNKRHGRR